ncbi:MAG: YbfB/YjiJ family MFS transporter, partial [Acetobacteraceae bacterium]
MRAGLCALLVGLGLGRFAYTPLLPAMVTGGWFRPSEAASLGAANLIAYLAGAAMARPLARMAPLRGLMRGAMLVTVATFAVCASRPGLVLFGGARCVAGLTGGVIMVLGPPSLLAAVPVERRGRAGGMMFSGVGLGIVLASLALPALLRLGVAGAWWGLAIGGAVATAIGWRGWPPAPPPPPAGEGRPVPALRRLILGYGVNAVALVPHMILISDFVARRLDA